MRTGGGTYPARMPRGTAGGCASRRCHPAHPLSAIDGTHGSKGSLLCVCDGRVLSGPVSDIGGRVARMPTRDEPRLTLRLGFALDGRLDGAAEGVGVKKGTLARRAIELGLEGAVEEARVARVERELLVAQRAARRAVNAGLVRVDGVVVRDPMTLVPAGARVEVES